MALVGLATLQLTTGASAQSVGGTGGGAGGGAGGSIGANGSDATLADAGGGGGGAGVTNGGAALGNGGAGGAGGTNGFEGDATAFLSNTAYQGVIGGFGQAGFVAGDSNAAVNGGGGGGGSGGSGAVVLSGTGPFNGTAAVTGGRGGDGGQSNYTFTGYGYGSGNAGSYTGGAGGDGGVGIGLSSVANLSLAATAAARGGAGGMGGGAFYTNESGYGYGYGNVASAFGGAGGKGGTGIVVLLGSTISNLGVVAGGTGGVGGSAEAFEGRATGTAGSGAEGGAGLSLVAGALTLLTNGGTLEGGTGGAGGGNSDINGFGGSGGIGLATASGTTGTILNTAGGVIAGGAGGTGGTGSGSASINSFGTRGGDGGRGIEALGSLTVTNQAGGQIVGGAGGVGGGSPGGEDPTGSVGGGGAGGEGVIFLASGSILNNAGSITGGAGGAAGTISGDVVGGFGGSGGTGVRFVNGGTLNNTGTITGGLAGAGNNGVGSGGDGGRGVVFGGNGSVTNSGTIAGSSRADGTLNEALVFTSGDHILTLKTGAAFVGNVLVEGSEGEGDEQVFGTNILQLDGAGTGTVNLAQFVAFDQLNQANVGSGGGGTWTLTGAGTVKASASVSAGTLVFGASSVLNAPTFAILTGGTASLSNGASLGSGATAVTLNGGSLQVTGTTLNSLANPFTFGPNGGTFDIADQGNTFTVSATLSGPGSLTKAGPGLLDLVAANTYAGGTVLNAGTIGIGNATALGGGLVTMANGSALRFLGGYSIANSVALNGAFQTVDTGTNTDTLSGPMSGSGSLVKIGAGTLNLTNTNTYAGGTFLDSGVIGVGSAGALGGGTLQMAAGTGLTFLGSYTVPNPIVFAMVGDPTFDTGANTDTLSGTISGTGALTKIGTGTLTLTGQNSYDGGTTITAGTLVGSATSFGAGAIVDNAGLVFDQATTASFTNGISGSGTVTKTGAGTLNLTTANTYAGATFVNGGSIGVGNPTALSTGPVNIADGAGLTFLGFYTFANAITLTGSGTLDTGTKQDTLTGLISGSGTLTKAGSGVLILPNANTYTGGTAINAGTVRMGNAGAIGNGGVTLANRSTLAFLGNYTLGNAFSLSGAAGGVFDTGGSFVTLTGMVGGTGSLTKTGSGTLALTAANTYTGGTFLDSGTIGIGNGLALGTGTLTMAPGTVLQFLGDYTVANAVSLATAEDPTIDTGGNAGTVTGSISGPGSLSKLGTGTLTLAGVNTYTGGTILAAGTLVGSATSFGSGGILDNGSLVLNQPTAANLANPISGTGTFTKTGAGTLDLTGVNTYSGASTIAGGTLLVDGSAVNSTFTVGGGSSFGGNGTIGGLIALSGATIAPGAGTPFSALNVTGNVTFGTGSIFQVQVNGAGQTDSVTAGGTATISGGTVNVLAGSGIYSVNTTYTLLTAAGGRTGQFPTLTTTSNLAFLTPTLGYDPTHVMLGFAQNGVTFPSVATTPNQKAAAGAIQGLGPGNPLFNAVLSQSASGAQQAFNAVSGEAHASAGTAAVTDARFVSTAVIDRLWNIGGAGLDAFQVLQGFGPTNLPTLVRCYTPLDTPVPANPSTYSVWGQAIGEFGRNSGNGNAGALERTLGGFIVGIDMPVYGALADVWRFGVSAGYTNDQFDTKSRGGSGSYESVFGSLYGGARFGAVDLRFGTSYGSNSTNMRRTVAFPGFLETERSSYGGETVQGFAEFGYRLAFGQSVFEPIAGFTAVHVHQDSFRESGGAAALLGFGRDIDVQTTTLGFRAEATPFPEVPLLARVMLGWQHAFGDLNPTAVLALRAGGTPFAIEGSPIDRDGAVSQVSLDYRMTTNLTLGLSYTGQVGERAYENGVRGRMDYRF